jgi:hypothetical protein
MASRYTVGGWLVAASAEAEGIAVAGEMFEGSPKEIV